MKKKRPSTKKLLLQEAEAKLAATPPIDEPPWAAASLLHELRVLQIELEIQNESLRKSEAALEESRNRYIDLYENAPVGYLSLNHAGLIAEANTTAATMLGVEIGQLLNRYFYSLIAEDDQGRWRQEYAIAMKQAGAQTLEMHLKRSDGSRLFVESKFTCVGLGSSSPTLRIVLTDFSKSRRLEKESRTLSAAILNSVPAEIAVIDADGIIIAVNRAWERFAVENAGASLHLGIGADYLAACSHAADQASPDVRNAFDGISAVLAGTLPDFFMEYDCDSPQQQRWFSMSVTPLGLVGEGVVIAHTDMSGRKQAELLLAKSEEHYRAVTEVAADGIMVFNTEGYILTVNDAYIRRSGYSREELLAMHISDIDVQGTLEDIRDHIEMVRRIGKDMFKTLHRAKDGEVWPVEISVSTWGSAKGGLAIMRDITERIRSEAALEAAHAEMEEAMRFHVASQTVAALAHDLNQPLNAVATYSEAALRMLSDGNPMPEKLQHALECNTQQAQRAGAVVHALLEFLNTGEVTTEPIKLSDIVRTALYSIEGNGADQFQFQIELDPDLPPVSANRLQVERVVSNLIRNSIDAMNGAGTRQGIIKVTARTSSDANMIQVTVRDNGPGFDTKVAHRIFDPFFSTKPKNLGMGLPIIRSIIEAHGGTIWLGSEPGEGASFHFTLPIAP